MSKDIYTISLLDLLPPSLKSDPNVEALAKALDPEIQAVSAAIVECILLARIDELPGDVIDLLAWQLHTDLYNSGLSIEKKRALVRSSLMLHRQKGTPEAVEAAARIVFGRSWIDEWFDYGGDPYYFQMNVEASQQGASETDLALLDHLVTAYKNTRSWLEVVNIYLTGQGGAKYASCTNAGENTTIYPWSITELEQHGPMRFAAAYQVCETTTIYPAA